VFLRALLRDEAVELWGDGSVVRDYVYAGDVADACVRGLERDTAAGHVYNVASGRGTSLLELLEACAAAAGIEPTVVRTPARTFDVDAIVLDPDAARRDLGWTATTSLEEGLARALAWLRDHLRSDHPAFGPATAERTRPRDP
jgi:UDP-glucose 4-epimerase